MVVLSCARTLFGLGVVAVAAGADGATVGGLRNSVSFMVGLLCRAIGGGR